MNDATDLAEDAWELVDHAVALAELTSTDAGASVEAVDEVVAELDALAAGPGHRLAVVDVMRGIAYLHRFLTFDVGPDADVGLALLERALPAVPDDVPLLDLALFLFATVSAAAHRADGTVAGLGRLRDVLDPDDERRDGLDELESDLLYAVWAETGDPDQEAAATAGLEQLCGTADPAPPTALLRCGEMRAYRVFCADAGDDTGPDLDAAVGWLDAAAAVGAAEDRAITMLLLGMCLWRREARARTGTGMHRAAACLDEALRLGLPEPKHTVTAHAERLILVADRLVADSPTATDVATADVALREAFAAQARHTDVDLGRRAQLAMGLARVEMLVFVQQQDVLDVERVRRNLDLAARYPEPLPHEWRTLLGVLRGGLQVFVDGTGTAVTGDVGVASFVEALAGTRSAEAVEPLRRMIGYASVVAGGRTGGRHGLASAEAVLGHPDAPPAERFVATCTEIYRRMRDPGPDPQLPALIDRAFAIADEIPPDTQDGHHFRYVLLPMLHVVRASMDPTGSALPSAAPIPGGAAAGMLTSLLELSRAMVAIAALDGDPIGQERALDELERQVRAAPTGGLVRGTGAGTLLTLWARRAERRHDPADADRAVAWVAEALAHVGGPEHPHYTRVTWDAARCHRLRGGPGDDARSRDLGLATLRGHAWMVLLQSDTDDAVAAAREAAVLAVRVARWCLADRVADDLVAALDAGRGLVLQAALTTRTVADRLRAAGHDALAHEWTDAGGDDRVALDAAAGLDLHSDLRRRVLLALGSGPVGLLEHVTTSSIRATLAAQAAAALVYLVPAAGDDPGLAVVVPAHQPVEVLELPDLDAATATALARAVAAGPVARDLVPPERRPAPDGLADLLDFAWRAAGFELAELADRLAGPDRRPPSLQLVPFGALALVPWHAARPRTGPGLLRHAVISYVPSVQLLARAQARPAHPGGAALIIGDPTGDLRAAGLEARSIVTGFHPRATYLGTARDAAPGDPAPSGPGAADELLARLADGAEPLALLHLACHARADPSAPGRSSVVLADRAVDVRELLAVRRAAPLDVDTVCLAGCSTNVAGNDYDEAFSIATAFLAAGARTAYGSMWPVPDGHTSSLMFMVHHHLRTDGCSPAEALHRAQLWAADPDRVAPPTMPAALARGMTGGDDPIAWAGFQHVGT